VSEQARRRVRRKPHSGDGGPDRRKKVVLKVAICEHGKFGAAGYKKTAIEDLADQCALADTDSEAHLFVVHDVEVEVPIPTRPRWERIRGRVSGTSEASDLADEET